MGAMILAEIGDFSRFDSAGKKLAYSGMFLSAYLFKTVKLKINYVGNTGLYNLLLQQIG